MRDDKKSPQHSKGGGTGRPSQLEGILLEHFDLYMWSKVFALWESNEVVLAGSYMNLKSDYNI